MTLPSDAFMHFAASFSRQQLAALESEAARLLCAAVDHWLESGGTYEDWWAAVSCANAYLCEHAAEVAEACQAQLGGGR
jgi:hypothetical protein